MRRIPRVLALLFTLGIALASVSLYAATQNALLTGSVFDHTGAPIPGATVRLINAGTGFSQGQSTDSNGNYTFTTVPPADGYVLSVEMSGFATEIRQELEINVGDNKLVLPPFLLQPFEAAPPEAAPAPAPAPTPGAPEPAVQPTPAPAQPPAAPAAPAPPARVTRAPAAGVSLELINTTHGGVIDSRTVRTLPLVGRDFIDLALLVPGTYPVEQGSALEGASLVVNGVRASMNNFLLDGVDNNDYTINQSLPFQIVEAMQEFRVQTSASTAEYGRTGGAQINTISRSGSNVWHGTAYGFLRNSGASAKDFFSAYNGGTFHQYALSLASDPFGLFPFFDLPVPQPFNDPELRVLYNRRKPHLIQNQFGGNVGGALVKDKLFAFFNWEGFRVTNPRPVLERVPELYLRDPETLFRIPIPDPPGFFLQPINPISVALYNLYPLPNVPIAPRGCDYDTVWCITDPDRTAFHAGESRNKTHSDNFLGRIDWRLNERASLSFKHNVQLIDQVKGGTVPATATYPGNGSEVDGRNQNFSFNYAHQFTSHLANELRLGWNRFRLATFALDRSIDPATLGLQNLNFRDRGLPTLLVGGSFASWPYDVAYTSLGPDLSTPSARVSNVWSAADNASYIWGRHNLKFGGEVRLVRLNATNEALARGVLSFYSGDLVAAWGLPDVASIARVSSDFGGGFDRAFRSRALNGFLQDQWRPASRFTVNYGVRYEFNQPPVEVHDRLVNFYPAYGGLVRAGSTAVLSPYFGDEPLGTASQPAPRAGFESDRNNLAPHVGLALDPWNNGKTVVRAGYALAYDQQPMEPSVSMLHNPPFVQQWFSYFPWFVLGDTFPAGFPDVSDTSVDLDGDGWYSDWIQQPYSITARDPGTRTSLVHQLHGGIQQRLGNRAMFEVAYAGSLGRKLPRLRDISPCPPAAFIQTDGVACTPSIEDPFLFESILNQENSANSNFHSMLVRFDIRNLRGLQMRAHYQWAKAIDNASSAQPQVMVASPLVASFLTWENVINPEAFSGVNNISPTLSLRPELPILTTRPRLPQDSTNVAGERGRSDFDVRQRLVLHYVYDFPRWERAKALGIGWQVAGVTTIQSGQPFTVFVDYFGIPLRPNQVSDVQINYDTPEAAIDNGVPLDCGRSTPCEGITATSAFDLSPTWDLTPGSVGRNSFTGPRLVNFDFALLKNTYFGAENRVNFQFRVEFFNLFNHTNFRQPYSQGGITYTDFFFNETEFVPHPFFGKILQARPARQIQFGLKFIF